jgi:hypothetical protein
MSTRVRPLAMGYLSIRLVVPGILPITTLSPVRSLIRLLFPEFGLPVKTMYTSDIATLR